MDIAQIEVWLKVIADAEAIGQPLIDVIKDHAKATLSDVEYGALETAWSEDAARAKANAGL